MKTREILAPENSKFSGRQAANFEVLDGVECVLRTRDQSELYGVDLGAPQGTV